MVKKFVTKLLATGLATALFVANMNICILAEPINSTNKDLIEKQKITDEITEKYSKLLNNNRPESKEAKYVENVDELLGGKVIPNSWDARNSIPTVRAQKDWGLCWAFSTIGNVEIAAVNAGLTDKNIDLSEYFEGYIGSNYSGKYTNGDSIESKKNEYSWAKSGYFWARGLEALMNWYGPVSEIDEEYNLTGVDKDEPSDPHDKDEIKRDQYHVRGIRYVNRRQPELVKEAIIESGSVSTGYAANQSSYTLQSYKGGVITTYFSGATKDKTNHDVLITGWDDSIPAELFTDASGNHPKYDGGWMVRNSWGSDWGDDGYFWISYEDESLDDTLGQIIIDTNTNYNNIYQYDAPYRNATLVFDNECSISNVFNVNQNGSGAEKISAVAFETDDSNLDYSIQLYRFGNKSEFENNPEGGAPVYDNPLVGKTTFPGYYTVDLPSVVVDEGELIAVVIKLSKPSEKIGVVTEIPTTTFTGSINRYVTRVINEGESFVKDESGWHDLSTKYYGEDTNNNIAIKLYTDNTKEPADQIRSFVKRLYLELLEREPEDKGLSDWTKSIKNDHKSAIDILDAISNSKEFNNKAYSNEEIVKKLYLAMLDREADEGGLNDWKSQLDDGKSIKSVILGFADSAEFKNLCKKYGIEPGGSSQTEPRDKNKGITDFVSRCYTEVLGRTYDVDGLNYWCKTILDAPDPKNEAKKTATNGFFHSEEFISKAVPDSEYVKILYRTFLGREYDEAGYADWTKRLADGLSRDEVMAGFADSKEFSNIMSKYGL